MGRQLQSILFCDAGLGHSGAFRAKCLYRHAHNDNANIDKYV